MSELKFTFGKNKGKRPDQLKSSSLRWYLEQDWFNAKFKALSNLCNDELEYRDKYNCHTEEES